MVEHRSKRLVHNLAIAAEALGIDASGASCVLLLVTNCKCVTRRLAGTWQRRLHKGARTTVPGTAVADL